ncbi:MAG: acyl-CoA thioesterase [Oligoflexia bacterium]|nr:acyl-CoA thioesterase [Oligoflexia bacterium]
MDSVKSSENSKKSSEIFRYDLQILERHLDTLGHVNNATYLQILEEARWDFITCRGFGLNVVQERGLAPIILELQVKYRREVRNRQLIWVESQCHHHEDGKIRIYVEQKIFGEAHGPGRPTTEASFVMGTIDLQRRKIVIPPPEFMQAMGLS